MISELKSLLCKEVIYECDVSKNSITHIEDSKASKDSRIKILEIYNLPNDVLAFTLDYKSEKDNRFDQLSPYLNKQKSGINMSCDIVIVWCGDGDINALIFDLKSSSNKPDKYSKQLNNSKLFVQYLFELFKFHIKDELPKINYYKTIGFTRGGLLGRNTINQGNNQRYEEGYKLVSLNLQPKSNSCRVSFTALI